MERDFTAAAPNRKWATDVTQLNIGATRLYLSPMLNRYNCGIISHGISPSSNLEQVYVMLDKALNKFDNRWEISSAL